MDQDAQSNEQPQAQSERTISGPFMEHSELRIVGCVPTRHPAAAHYELRQKGHVEADEDYQAGDVAPEVVEHLTSHLWPPVEHTAKERNHRSTHHHVVEVSNYEVGVVQRSIG